MNIKHILTGKGLLETFKAENAETSTEQMQTENDSFEGLPVFNNISYANELSKLINCNELSQSFHLQGGKSPNKYDTMVSAIKLSDELSQI